jgi:hypothetical protein
MVRLIARSMDSENKTIMTLGSMELHGTMSLSG